MKWSRQVWEAHGTFEWRCLASIGQIVLEFRRERKAKDLSLGDIDEDEGGDYIAPRSSGI